MRDTPEMWSDWAGILAEIIRSVLESDFNPIEIENAKYNLEIFDSQHKKVKEAGFKYRGFVIK